MRYKFFGEPKFHDLKFYKIRAHAPHIDQLDSSLRLYIAEALITYLIRFSKIGWKIPISKVLDLGCGDGGLLAILAKKFPKISFEGYDLQPSNIAFAQERIRDLSNVEILLKDFTEEEIPKVDLTILTEVLEHLIEPDLLAERIKSPFLVLSTPLNENPSHHDPVHLWGWGRADISNIFKKGWEELFYLEDQVLQFIILKKL